MLLYPVIRKSLVTSSIISAKLVLQDVYRFDPIPEEASAQAVARIDNFSNDRGKSSASLMPLATSKCSSRVRPDRSRATTNR